MHQYLFIITESPETEIIDDIYASLEEVQQQEQDQTVVGALCPYIGM